MLSILKYTRPLLSNFSLKLCVISVSLWDVELVQVNLRDGLVTHILRNKCKQLKPFVIAGIPRLSMEKSIVLMPTSSYLLRAGEDHIHFVECLGDEWSNN